MARSLPTCSPKPNGSIWGSGTMPTSSTASASSCSKARLQVPQRHFLGQAPTCLPIFLAAISAACHRNHHLGRHGQKVPPHLQLQGHEGNQSRQANEVRLGYPSPRVLGKVTSGKHPTQKPVALLERIPPSLHQRRRTRVLDPFAGSGMTALAAIRTKRVFRGIEIDPKWVRVSVERIKEHSSGQLRVARTANEIEAQAFRVAARAAG